MDKPKIKVRLADPDDIPELHQMIQELAVFEGVPEGPKLSVKELIEDGFSSQPWFFALVAERENEKKILGWALCNRAYSSWTGRAFYVEDLYVREEERRSGIGSALLGYLATICVKEKARRIDWHVLINNEPAIAFYKRIGARDLRETEDRTAMRLDEPFIQKLAESFSNKN